MKASYFLVSWIVTGLFSFHVWAVQDAIEPAVVVSPPGEVQFLDYEPKGRTFELVFVGEEGAGPFYVDAEGIVKAVSELTRQTVCGNPESILNKNYKLTGKIGFYPDIFREQRKLKGDGGYCNSGKSSKKKSPRKGKAGDFNRSGK
ncbi:MAG TPA: hypothetical protein DCL41_02730 [Bdellovibrionales bacterium]|nr:hypothetical protein [Pseudobdellovibrionaceae bacterium]HAG90756.1 hypothetical protein [Bdellovibrionales bacterium]|tara:strand:- start:102 stop:539 length:438 start_codon:yes stop_codon:yes gene_type:complete